MFEDFSAQKPIAIWNPARGVWENPEAENLLCAHLEPFWATWPVSGMTRGGRAYALPTQALHTAAFEFLSSPIPVMGTHTTATSGRSSRFRKGANPNPVEFVEDLLRSPKASEGSGGALGEAEALRRGNTVGVRDQVLDLVADQGLKVSRVERNEDLLPTTRVSMSKGPTRKEIEAGNPKTRIETEVMLGDLNWGRFAPAIERWEELLGRKAPAPTKPDGKDGSHRLSSAFTEWLMGVPEGWITGAGLTRTEELKAAGNGVVPQQARLALSILLDDTNFA